MKILIVSNLFPPHAIGGYEILCRQVCDLLVKRGHVIHVLTSDYEIGNSSPTPDFCYEVTRELTLSTPFNQPHQSNIKRELKCFTNNCSVTEKMISRVAPDLIFYWSQLRLTLGPLKAKRSNCKASLITFNDDNIRAYKPRSFTLRPKGLAKMVLQGTLLRSTVLNEVNLTAATCISRQLLSQLEALKLPLPPIQVIYQGIPIENWPCKKAPGSLAKGTPEDPLILCYAGQLHHYKGVHTLIEAAGLLQQKHPELTIIVKIAGSGDDAYRLELEHLANANKPVDIRFLNRLPHAELSRVYQESNVFIFPSIWKEPFGLTHLEAMASGTTVISTADGGHGEFLRHEQNALVFEKENAHHLAESLERLVQSPDLSLSLARGALKTVHEEFSLNRYVDDLERLMVKSVESVK
jgi:glycogen synthase